MNPRKIGAGLPEDSDPDFLGEIIEVAKPRMCMALLLTMPPFSTDPGTGGSHESRLHTDQEV